MISEFLEILTHRQRRSFVRAHYFIVVTAVEIQTGGTGRMVLWDGEDTKQFTLPDYGLVTCYGAGRILQMPDFTYEVGLDAKTYEIRLSQVDEAVQTLIRGYNTRLAPVDIFRGEFNERGKLIATPRNVFKGFIDGNPLTTPEFEGETGGVAVRVSSDAKKLTRYGYHMKSHDYQKTRQNDQFRKYSSVKVATVPWGRKTRRNEGDAKNPRNF